MGTPGLADGEARPLIGPLPARGFPPGPQPSMLRPGECPGWPLEARPMPRCMGCSTAKKGVNSTQREQGSALPKAAAA
jgi:hypothetical protein